MWLVCQPSRAGVPTPPNPPAVPAGTFCSTIYNELNGYLQSFNRQLGTPPQSASILRTAQLQQADANTGPGLSSPNYLAGTLTQAQELKAMGFKAIKISIGFPLLYEPFWGSQTAMAPYLTYYQQLVQTLHQWGLKVIVENTILQSNNPESGWTNLLPFYSSLNWTAYMSARASMASTIAKQIAPDYLILAEEPDTEAANTGQTNLNNPVDAAAMITEEITSVRLVDLTVKLGAGFGTWLGQYPPSSLLDYLAAYVVLPLDYIDYHIYPINTEQGVNLLSNSLVIAQQAALAKKPVAISESWMWKMENAEFNTQPSGYFSARNPFSFWAPLDTYFDQTIWALADYTQANYTPMLYASTQNVDSFFAYQTYGGTTSNGGAANCTCTTDSCDQATILGNANLDAIAADKIANFTTVGLSYNKLLVSPPDTTAPTTPTSLTASQGYTSATLSWNGSTDNVGLAGYNVYRCTPSAPGQSCTGVWIANATTNSYFDSTLSESTTYNYQVQAFDMANNRSAMSNTVSFTTYRNTPPSSPTNVTASSTSYKAIQVNWQAPSGGGISQYLIFAGTTKSNLVQVGTMPGSVTQWTDQPLQPSTTYYFGVKAVAQGKDSPMSTLASATTPAGPASPSRVGATVNSGAITLNWQENTAPDANPIVSYTIYRGTAPGAFVQIATCSSTSYTDAAVVPGINYYYTVVAVDNELNDSVPSAAVSIAMPQ